MIIIDLQRKNRTTPLTRELAYKVFHLLKNKEIEHGQIYLGREGMLDDTKQTKNEKQSLMNNSNVDQVELYKKIKDESYKTLETYVTKK